MLRNLQFSKSLLDYCNCCLKSNNSYLVSFFVCSLTKLVLLGMGDGSCLCQLPLCSCFRDLPESFCYESQSHGTIRRPRHVWSKRHFLVQRDGNLRDLIFPRNSFLQASLFSLFLFAVSKKRKKSCFCLVLILSEMESTSRLVRF